jgi:hypothetical protein
MLSACKQKRKKNQKSLADWSDTDWDDLRTEKAKHAYQSQPLGKILADRIVDTSMSSPNKKLRKVTLRQMSSLGQTHDK